VNPVPDFLRQDMTVSVNVETDKRERALAIANDALSNIKGNKAVVVLVRDRKIQRQPVTLGLRGLAMSEVTSGLRAGDQVLANAEAVLEEGARGRLTRQDGSLMRSTDGSDSNNEFPGQFD